MENYGYAFIAESGTLYKHRPHECDYYNFIIKRTYAYLGSEGDDDVRIEDPWTDARIPEDVRSLPRNAEIRSRFLIHH